MVKRGWPWELLLGVCGIAVWAAILIIVLTTKWIR
jgi:hypothetical protein